MQGGARYDHDRCPIDGQSDSDATACVVVLDGGVFCYRCAAKGICAPGSSTPGFYPFRRVLESPTTVLDELAKNWVHWSHARLVLRDALPNFGDRLLREAYRLTLIDRHREDDPRISMALQETPSIVWGQGMWLAANTLQPTELDDDAASGLPGCHDVDKDGRLELNRVRRSEFKKRTPPGYRPVRPYRGISFAPPDDTIAIRLPSEGPPIELLASPIPLDEALSALEHAFPRLNAAYLQAALAAVVCAESRGGQPPMIACTGPSGSGKEQHLRLAASFVGEDITKIPLNENDEAFNRQVGGALAAGNRFLVVDELGKIKNLSGRLPQLLAISANVQWRPLYENRAVTTPFRGVLCFPTVRLPDFLRYSDEFRRRVHEIRLHHRMPNWMKTSGGDTTDWRSRNEGNAQLANSILTHVWRLCREHGFLFERVAEVLGLNPPQPADQAVGDEQYRALYRHCRGEDGTRKLLEDATFVRGWVDLDSPAAKSLIAPLLPETDANDPRKARNILRTNLEAVSWNDVLGIEDPPIRLEIKIHGARWGMRFIADEPAMRGRERVNEQLPAIPGGVDDNASPAAPEAGDTAPLREPQAPPSPSEPPAAPSPDDAADALRKAGLPL